MGFINFLKKKDKQDKPPAMDEPPAPPSMDMPQPPDFDEKAPESPQEYDTSQHELPPMPQPPEDEESFQKPEHIDEPMESPDHHELPEFPNQDDFEQIESPQFEYPQEKQEDFTQQPNEEEVIQQVNQEKETIPHYNPPAPDYSDTDYDSYEEPRTEVNGPLFIEARNFQLALGRIKTTKKELKEFEDKIFQLQEIKNKEEKKLELWKSKLEDIQRKLIHVDKTLFEDGDI